MDDLAHQRQLRRLRDEVLSTPNCPACLHRMEPTEEGWACADCGRIDKP